MPFLSWVEESVSHESVEVSPGRMRLVLNLSEGHGVALLKSLEELFYKPSKELRLVISEEWTLFWKVREEGSRLLVAHPQSQEWVGTVALERQAGQTFVDRLRDLEMGASLTLHEVVPVHPVSNLVLQIRKDR